MAIGHQGWNTLMHDVVINRSADVVYKRLIEWREA
jgi:hypothetical protein